MWALPLSAADRAAYHRGLFTDHQIRVRATITDLDHRVVADATSCIESGQVDVDGTQDIDRSCSLDLFDPGNDLGLTTGGPADVAMSADRMVHLTYGVRSTPLDRWVDVPIFTGPITQVSRSGDVVKVTAQGKEALSKGPSTLTKSYGKGTSLDAILWQILHDMGETRLDLPRTGKKAGAAWTLVPADDVWVRAQGIATSLGRVLHYDGDGWARLRPVVGNQVLEVRHGTGGGLLGVPEVSYDLSSVKNYIWVQGATPAKSKTPVGASAVLPSSHPMSPQRLARGGKWRYLREDVQDDTITTTAQAAKVAKATLEQRQAGAVDVSADILPVPALEVGDMVRITTPEWTMLHQIQRFSIPLDGGAMSIGYHRATRSIRRGVRHSRKVSKRG